MAENNDDIRHPDTGATILVNSHIGEFFDNTDPDAPDPIDPETIDPETIDPETIDPETGLPDISHPS